MHHQVKTRSVIFCALAADYVVCPGLVFRDVAIGTEMMGSLAHAMSCPR